MRFTRKEEPCKHLLGQSYFQRISQLGAVKAIGQSSWTTEVSI